MIISVFKVISLNKIMRRLFCDGNTIAAKKSPVLFLKKLA